MADYPGQAKKLIKEARDSIYNMYEDQALKGNLGTGPQVAAQERRFKRGDQIKKKQRQGYEG
jgi:hypothetical protein